MSENMLHEHGDYDEYSDHKWLKARFYKKIPSSIFIRSAFDFPKSNIGWLISLITISVPLSLQLSGWLMTILSNIANATSPSGKHNILLSKSTLREKCPYSEFFWSVFSRIRTEYGVSLRIQSECGKIRTRKTPNTDTFHVVQMTGFYMKCNTGLNWVKGNLLY